jgi:hypothetical protein
MTGWRNAAPPPAVPTHDMRLPTGRRTPRLPMP